MNILKTALFNSVERIEARIENNEALIATFEEKIAELNKVHNPDSSNEKEKTLKNSYESLKRKIKDDKNLLKIFNQRLEEQLKKECKHERAMVCLGDDESLYCPDCKKIISVS